MKIVIAAAGSYGDVAPFTGLGARLQEAGHQVALATHDSYASLVKTAGLEFRRLPADPRADSGQPGRGPGQEPASGGKRELMRRAAAFVRELGKGVAEATAPGADLLLLTPTTGPLGRQAGEATGTPSLSLHLQPTHPTGDFPPVVGGTRSLGRWGNRAAGRLSLRVVDRLYAGAVRELRTELGLPPASATALRTREEKAGRPVLHGFSQVLLPRPADWRPGLEVVGNWWPYVPPEAQLPPALADFLASGPPPVFIGFGSMASGEGERLGELAVRALRRAKARGVLQSGWAGLTGPEGATDDVLTVGEVPHALLFPHTAAVVHHCGAGTAAAGLRAGVPTVPVPVTADQPFWAARLAALGAATTPIPFSSLSDDHAEARLATAITEAVQEASYRRRASAAARRMAAEDGASEVLKAVERIA
ncbi:glycosyltransferase [Streptomyces sp. MST-110588]|uniref:glycosyltransferase n=1 Tax=Streptomyces sp. MST-110588 TaxID=2833628 RepID=UPI001F5CEA67|nr:glycosyltransferase [Streptomyces sp. MST-110588]UNO41547.1 glycosyltransferase family 1 protein [Streptomyces sp. MST-110588]